MVLTQMKSKKTCFTFISQNYKKSNLLWVAEITNNLRRFSDFK